MGGCSYKKMTAAFCLMAVPFVFAVVPVLLLGLNLRQIPYTDLMVRFGVSASLVISVAALSCIFATSSVVCRLNDNRLVSPLDFAILFPLVAGEVFFGASLKLSGLVGAGLPFGPVGETIAQFTILAIYYSVFISRAAALFVLLMLKATGTQSLQYARSNGVGPGEYLIEVSPSVRRNIVSSCILLALVLCISTSSINSIGFRSGYSYGLELWPQMLSRAFNQISANNPKDAISLKSTAYFIVTVLSLMLAWLLLRYSTVSHWVQRQFIQSAPHAVQIFISKTVMFAALGFSIFVACLPAYAVLNGGTYAPRSYDYSAFAIGIVVSLVVGAIAVFLSRSIGLSFQYRSNDRGYGIPQALIMLAGAAVLVPLPSLAEGSNVVMLKMGFNHAVFDWAAWAIATFSFLFPITFAFTYFLATIVSGHKLSYARSNEISEGEYFKTFIFSEEKEVLFLFALIMSFLAWCSLPVASLYDQSVQTLATVIFNLTESRGAPLRAAATIMTLASVGIVVVLSLFGRFLTTLSEDG